MHNSTFKPVYTNYLLSCSTSQKSFISNDKTFNFSFEKNPDQYDYNGVVKIENVSFEYKNIGIYDSTNSSRIVYVNGKPYFFTPDNATEYFINGEPYTIFTRLHGRVKMDDLCDKSSDKATSVLINLFHVYSNIFFVGMKITVTGTINGKPFTSSFPSSNDTQTNTGFVDVSFFNFPMPVQLVSRLAVNTECPFNLDIINKFDLCLNCMQKESVYYAIPKADPENPDNITTVGYFPLKFSFVFQANVFSSASRKFPMYLETVPFEDTNMKCIIGENFDCSEETEGCIKDSSCKKTQNECIAETCRQESIH